MSCYSLQICIHCPFFKSVYSTYPVVYRFSGHERTDLVHFFGKEWGGGVVVKRLHKKKKRTALLARFQLLSFLPSLRKRVGHCVQGHDMLCVYMCIYIYLHLSPAGFFDLSVDRWHALKRVTSAFEDNPLSVLHPSFIRSVQGPTVPPWPSAGPWLLWEMQ